MQLPTIRVYADVSFGGEPMSIFRFRALGAALLRLSSFSRHSRLFSFAILAMLSTIPLAQAHHSAAVFYNNSEAITLTGEVGRFNFRNPHAIVELLVTNENGEVERWTCETSAPSALRRRGWSQQSMAIGETITLEGIRARDGSLLMRITKATKADGTVIGVSRNLDD